MAKVISKSSQIHSNQLDDRKEAKIVKNEQNRIQIHTNPSQNVSNSTKGASNVSNLIASISKKSKATKAAKIVQAPLNYVSLEQASKILGLSIYRTRQLQWEQKIAPKYVIKKSRRVFYLQKAIEDLKIERESSQIERSDLDQIRFAKRVLRSIETMTFVMKSDVSMSKPLKQSIFAQFEQYQSDSLEIVQKSIEEK